MTKGGNLHSLPGGIEANHQSNPASTSPTINTPSTSPRSQPSSRRHSPYRPSGLASKTRFSPPPGSRSTTQVPSNGKKVTLTDPKDFAGDIDSGEDEGADDMESRPPLHRPTDGRSETPLLKDERGRPAYDVPNGSARPPFAARRSTFRSRSPDMEGSSAVRKKYTYAGFFLILSLISFTIQTETAVYIQHDLGWNKAYAMLWVPNPCPTNPTLILIVE